MTYRQLKQTSETKSTEYTEPLAEKETSPTHQPMAGPTLAKMGRDVGSQAAVLQRVTGGKLARAGQTLLQLQNQYGNQHVQNLINPQQSLTVQPKLTLGAVNTPSEKEAERVSSEIVRGSGQLTTAPTAVSGSATAVSPEIEREINQARGGGQPLPEDLRFRMAQNLGADLSGVRVHTNAQSDHLNEALQAQAFTTGQDIFFEAGAYSPGSSEGQALIAHELTHVVQQYSGIMQNRQENIGDTASSWTAPDAAQTQPGISNVQMQPTIQRKLKLKKETKLFWTKHTVTWEEEHETTIVTKAEYDTLNKWISDEKIDEETIEMVWFMYKELYIDEPDPERQRGARGLEEMREDLFIMESTNQLQLANQARQDAEGIGATSSLEKYMLADL